MARSSLTKFTVPTGGEDSQGLLMPKLKFRYRAEFVGFGVSKSTTELTRQLQSFSRPQIQFDAIEVPVYNSKAYFAGRPTWQAVSCTLRDDATGGVTKLVGEQIQKQFDFIEQASAVSGIDYKFQVNIEMLDGGNGAIEPNVLEKWELYGCFITEAQYGDVDYGSNDPMTITLSIRYDNAIQTSGGGLNSPNTRAEPIGDSITG